MTTFQFKLKKPARITGEKSIVISFIKDRKNTSLSIHKSCLENQWCFDTERVKKNHPDQKKLNAFIDRYKIIIQQIIDELEDENAPYTLPDLIGRIKTFKGKNKTLSYTSFQTESIQLLRKLDKLNSADIEVETLRSLQIFFNKPDIGFNEINYMSLKRYEAFCTEKGNKPSTISIRMRTIRSIFNKAIKANIIKQTQYPFTSFKISKIKSNSKKEFLTQDEIELLVNYVPENTNEIFAKNMFLFSYYSRGINFVDMMKLEKNDISNGTISYLRSKTNIPVNFQLVDKNKNIIRKYASDNDSKYIFYFIRTDTVNNTYLKNKGHKKLSIINSSLKDIMNKIHIEKHITFYCARHSFATALKFANISVDIIKEALGHKDIQSTMSYLNTLPDARLNKIIEDVIF